MSSSLYVLFNGIKKDCLQCSYLKSFNPDASQNYKNKVIMDLIQISKWKTAKSLDTSQNSSIDNYKTFASEALAKCSSKCLNRTPAVARYLEEKLNDSEAPEVASIPRVD